MIPIVLHHGLFGFTNFDIGALKVRYFSGGIDRAIAQRGHPVIISRVHPTAGIAMRARQLKELLLRQLEIAGIKGRVVLIGHSLGGLDARYMITRLGMADRVAALLTICTPHRGSPYADWCMLHLGRRLGGLRLMQILGLDVEAIADLTTARCREFNEAVLDAAGVRYFSVGAARPWHLVPPWALLSHKIIADAEGDNDGLVSLQSARWGEFMEPWPADHFHSINKRFVVELKNPTGDITPYYLAALGAMERAGVEMKE